MKKPKFNQLRGTPAHSLRHRLCLGFTLGALGLGVAQWFLMSAFITHEPAPLLRKYADKLLNIERKNWFVAITVEDVKGSDL